MKLMEWKETREVAPNKARAKRAFFITIIKILVDYSVRVSIKTNPSYVLNSLTNNLSISRKFLLLMDIFSPTTNIEILYIPLILPSINSHNIVLVLNYLQKSTHALPPYSISAVQ